MKGVIVICFFALAAGTLARPDKATYTEKFDNINLDEILGNKRLLDAYVNCINSLGKCTAAGNELKYNIHDALETNCQKCTPAQSRGADRVISFLIQNHPKTWEELKAKHDPTGQYAKKYEDRLKAVKT